MTAIQCPGCKAHLSVKGLVNCPLCQAYLNPPHRQAAASAVAPAVVNRNWLAIVMLGAIAAAGAAVVGAVAFPSAEKVRHRQVIEALSQCQHAVAKAAQYGGADLPPYAENHGSGDEFYFAWPSGSFTFSNAFGARIKMSASCVGVISTGTISQLTVNGKDFR